MKKIIQLDQDNPNNQPTYFLNDTTQTVYFKSILKKYFPWAKDDKTLICKPGQIIMVPDRYYEVYTHDGKQVKLKEIKGEMIENFSEKSLTHGH